MKPWMMLKWARKPFVSKEDDEAFHSMTRSLLLLMEGWDRQNKFQMTSTPSFSDISRNPAIWLFSEIRAFKNVLINADNSIDCWFCEESRIL